MLLRFCFCTVNYQWQKTLRVTIRCIQENILADIHSRTGRALKLLDEAENRGTMLPYLISDLRSMAYRNMYMNKLAFDYARKSYVLDSVSQNNPEHFCK